MDKLRQITSGKPRALSPQKGGGLAVVAVAAVATALIFLGEVWSVRSERGRLERTVGNHRVLLTEYKSASLVKCGSYRIVGTSGTWLFVEKQEDLWAQSALPSQDLPEDIEHDYVNCDTYVSGRHSSTIYFAPQVLAVANWR